MKTGDRVRINCEGRTVDGVIVLASDNERSLFLTFEALLDGHLGAMPVLLDEHGVYRSIINNVAVEIERVQ